MKTLLLAVGWLVGFIAAAATAYYLSWCLAVFITTGIWRPGPGAMWIPRWVFALCLLLLLGKTKELKELYAWLEERFDPEAQEEKRAQQEALRKEWHG